MFLIRQVKQQLYYKGKIVFIGREYDSFTGDIDKAITFSTKEEAEAIALSGCYVIEIESNKSKKIKKK